ncbi:MAG: outer membrane lipoprotein carrier protein LolA [Ignavibacteriae bacterium]|jgi:outer membrane lipoprotein-sorting protein|nr:outer membrane lipoprotein carrier protein LolA [Ignavibacteriota bacterium]NOG96918.1 outer membrane lipoprotein carrier protein LolA [Ignavibacteriota bacterium]
MITKILLSLTIFLHSFSYQQNADEILKIIQNKFESIKSFSADFIESTSGAEGDFSFQKENRFKIKTSKQEITSNGSIIWNYDKKLNRVVINNIDNEPSGFSLQQYLFEYPEECDINVLDSKPDEKILELIPRTDELGFSSAKIFVDENYMLKKIELNNDLQSGIKFEFKNVNTDVNFTDNHFEFNPPKGSRIIDLR